MTRSERAIQQAVADAILMSLARARASRRRATRSSPGMISEGGVRSGLPSDRARSADGAVHRPRGADPRRAARRPSTPSRSCSPSPSPPTCSWTSSGCAGAPRSARPPGAPDRGLSVPERLGAGGPRPRLVQRARWRRSCASSGMTPRDVVVEITERRGGRRATTASSSALRTLKERGYRVAVDDMGAGHASLQALAAIEPDFLKFDISLVRDIDKSSIKRSLLESLRGLAEKIRARVIAEGDRARRGARDAAIPRDRVRPGLPVPPRGARRAERRGHPAVEDPEERSRRAATPAPPTSPTEHGVTERTIRRDIEALQEAGFPLYDERADGQEGLAPRRGLQAAPHPDLHALGAGGPLLRQEPDVVPGRRALRPGPRVGLRQDPRGAAGRRAFRTSPASRTCSRRGPTPGRTTRRSRT